MLKQTLLLFTVFTVLLSGCSKSDEVTPTSLIGTWSIDKISYDIDGKIFTSSALKDYDWEKLQWKIDDKKVTFLPENESFNYTYDAKTKTMVQDDEGDKYNYTIDVTNNTLKATSVSLDLTKTELSKFASEEIFILFSAEVLIGENAEFIKKFDSGKKMTMIFEFKK